MNTKEVSKDAKSGSAHHLRQSCVDVAHVPPDDSVIQCWGFMRQKRVIGCVKTHFFYYYYFNKSCRGEMMDRYIGLI